MIMKMYEISKIAEYKGQSIKSYEYRLVNGWHKHFFNQCTLTEIPLNFVIKTKD